MNFFLNLDFIYYLIYLFFRSIWDFFAGIFVGKPEAGEANINLIDLINYLTGSDYSIAGEGLTAMSDGYSIFRPPHGFDSWGDSWSEAFSNWLTNFMTNPYCPECSSFFDIIFGGWNSLFWLSSFLVLILFWFLKEKEEILKDLEWEKYEKVFEKEDVNSGNKKTERWQNILKLVESENKNDWRMAIMDADNLLDEILIEQGYSGTNLGERLKSADFDTLQNAWEAHKVRNSIAHDSNFDLSKRETKRVIQNYSLVFNEFYYL